LEMRAYMKQMIMVFGKYIFCQIQNPIDLDTLGQLLMGRLIDISHVDRWETAFKYT
jgi:hypothetical protein